MIVLLPCGQRSAAYPSLSQAKRLRKVTALVCMSLHESACLFERALKLEQERETELFSSGR